MPRKTQVTIGASPTAAPPDPYVCSAVQPSGPQYTQIQTLTGADFDNQVNSAPAGQVVSLQGVLYTWSNFTNNIAGTWSGANITRKGLFGLGDATELRMVANTSTHAADVPTADGSTNQLYLMRLDQDDALLQCLTIRGTEQGHYYNGIRFDGCDRPVMRNVKMYGIAPGYKHFPPGETFGKNWFNGADGLFENCFYDGRKDGATGVGDDATAFGANSYVNGTWRDCFAQYCPWSAAFALWQGRGDITLTDCGSYKNRTALNLERNGQEQFLGAGNEATLTIERFSFGDYVQTVEGYGQDIFLGNDRGSAQIYLIDPIIAPGRTVPPGRPANRIWIQRSLTYQGVSQKQLKEDVHVIVGGVEVDPANWITWSA